MVVVVVGAHYRPNAASREEILLHAVAVRGYQPLAYTIFPVLVRRGVYLPGLNAMKASSQLRGLICGSHSRCVLHCLASMMQVPELQYQARALTSARA